ncbi:MAG: PHB depolymerase family esterase [Bacteroidia bacterium]|nr:PHB depolymerase family esterase [Bacteroidia bacterium]
MKIILFFQAILFLISGYAVAGWQQVTNFGSNPGNLNMFLYVPDGIPGNAPMVVALHGCTQTAAQFRDNSGWNDLADKYKFYVIYPEQKATNNSYYCFNWFLPSDQNRDSGEALSILQMVDYVKSNYSVNNSKVFTTGLSAGAGMTAVLLAAYPDVFSGGAIMSGVAYKAASDAATASNAMYGLVTKTPTEWKNLVTGAYPAYTGTYPRVAVFHGLYDNVVYPANVTELVKQWTAVHNISQTPYATISAFLSNPDIEQAVYTNAGNDTVVLTYRINNMGHAIAVDPGTGIMQGGTIGTYAIDKNFYSSYWAAKFFGIADGFSMVNEPGQSENISIFPNPAGEKIHINYMLKNYSQAKLIFKNTLGEEVFQCSINQGMSILETDTQKWPAGLYQCSLVINNMIVETQKVVLTK